MKRLRERHTNKAAAPKLDFSPELIAILHGIPVSLLTQNKANI
jgi:hypothetical protein